VSPSSVVLDPRLTVQAGVRQTLQCRAVGAYPEANVTWTLDGKPLRTVSDAVVEQVGEDTVSRVQVIPRPEDNKAQLSCSAASRTLSDPPVSSTVTLNVTHAPIVELKLGSNLSPDNIRQGGDVYFDCQTTANPAVQKITWFKENKEVWQRSDAGVLVNGNNLVLQRVQRAHGGNYSCKATNAVATTQSNPVTLSVMYGPVCTQERQTVTAIEEETVELQCNVDANPNNVTFFWLFNNTVDSTRFREDQYTVEGSMSRLKYVAYSARDYGTVFCWAANVVAPQHDPCAFTLQPAGAPDSVEDCVLTNQSAGSLHITCKPGADGGLTQTFRAEVFLAGSGRAVRQRDSFTPAFTIEGLAPGEDYTVTISAVNRKGTSPPVSLQAYTLKVAENRMISGVPSTLDSELHGGSAGGGTDGYGSGAGPGLKSADGGMSPLAGAVAGAVGVLLAIVMTAVVFARKRCYAVRRRAPDLVSGQGQ
ncbi:Immunoglobulin-like domain, partial [Trinorchestia longiramus]